MTRNTWNYRIFKTKDGFDIREVHYENGKNVGYTGAIDPFGETLDELKSDLEYMLKAFNHPVIELNEMEYDEYESKAQDEAEAQKLVDEIILDDEHAAIDGAYLERDYTQIPILPEGTTIEDLNKDPKIILNAISPGISTNFFADGAGKIKSSPNIKKS